MVLQGAQPFEFFREQRRSARHVQSASDDDENYRPVPPSATDEADAAAHIGSQYSDRRSARRKAGHGCVANISVKPLRLELSARLHAVCTTVVCWM